MIGRALGLEIEAGELTNPASLPGLLKTHRVVLVRNFPRDPVAQLEVTAAFGSIAGVRRRWHGLGALPELRVEEDSHPNPYNVVWHADTSWARKPVEVVILYALAAGSNCAGIELADVVAGYAELAEAEQRRLAGMRVHHHVAVARAQAQQESLTGSASPKARVSRLQRWLRQRRSAWQAERATGVHQPTRLLQGAPPPGVSHPAVMPDAQGRNGLLLGEHAWLVEGLNATESREVLDALSLGVTRRPLLHRWRQGDLLLFDNLGFLHRRQPGVGAQPGARTLRRSLAWWSAD